MLLTTMGVGASLLVATQAILIPPAISSVKINSHTDSIPNSHFSKVACIGCPLFEITKDNSFVLINGVENSVVLNISVGAEPGTLELNGFRFYPPNLEPWRQVAPVTPSLPQVRADVPLTEIRAHPEQYLSHPLRVTGWSFQAGQSRTASDSGDELLQMKVHINGLEGQDVTIPDISITALKSPDARLTILHVDAQEASDIPTDTAERLDKECKAWPLMCKLRASIAHKLAGAKAGINRMKGCMRHPHGHGEPAVNMHHGPHGHHDGAGGHHGPPHHGPPHHGQPHHHPHHPHHPHGHHYGHHHRHHNGIHRFLHMAGRIVTHVIVPVLFGVAVGMATYLIGMLIGCGVALLWTKFRGHEYIALPAEEQVDDEEKCVYGDEKETFLEEPPVYEECEKEIVA